MEQRHESLAQKPTSISMRGPSRDSLVEQFEYLLKKVEPLCVPPPRAESTEQLWFHRSEFEVVNQVWMAQGISGVYERWGRERQYEGRSHEVRAAGDDIVLLSVMHFSPSISTGDAYFKFGHLFVPEAVLEEVLTVLKDSGLLARVMPERDSIRDLSLEGVPVVDVGLRCEIYGSQNPYGSGRFLILDVVLKPLSGDPLCLRLSLSSDGNVVRRLWDDGLYETGYEGHDFASFTLSDEELRSLMPVVFQISELARPRPVPLLQGMWNGNSLGV